MVRWGPVLFSTCMLWGQMDAPMGIVRGSLHDVSGNVFQFTAKDGRAFACRFDDKTWFESSNIRVSVGAFAPSDAVEMLADRRASGCYARTVRLSLPEITPGRPRSIYRGVTQHIAPRGDIEYSGVVTRMDSETLHIHTRTQGNRVLLLRSDTDYLESGTRSDKSRLPLQQRVFLRAGRNLEGEVEVYQVIWGDILSGEK